MGLSFFALISVFIIVLFLILILFTKEDKNVFFIKFILLAFPFIHINAIPGKFHASTFDVIVLLFFFLFYKRKKVQWEHQTTYLIFFILLVVSTVVGCVTAEHFNLDTLESLMRFVSLFIFAKVLTDECANDANLSSIVMSCFKAGLVFSLVFLALQLKLGVQFSLAKSLNENVLTDNTRYSSFFQDPQKFAQYLAAISFFYLIKKDNGKLPLINYLMLFLAIIGIFLAGGRAALGGWCLGLAFIIMLGKSSFRVIGILASLILFLIAYNFQEYFSIFHRAGLEESYDFRYLIWQEAFSIFTSHPLFGIGMGNYATYVSTHFPNQFWLVDGEVVYYDHPESGYLKFLAEFGLTGSLIIALFIFYPLFTTVKSFLKNHDMTALFLIASILSWMVGFYTVYSLGDVRIAILVVSIIALLITYKEPVLNNV